MIYKLKKIAFAIGSNLGDREENIKLAVKNIADKLNLKDLLVSKFYANQAMLPVNSDPKWNIEFLNITLVAKINIDNFHPLEILKIIKDIEKKIGRLDRPKWAPREIDIDILAIEDLNFKNDILEIPHQGLFKRDFFYKTFAQIDNDWFSLLKNKNFYKS
ncbi:2-amino-4-hydroxy-6-hydroxymethyldihydropteridine diphosphokinase [Alphaproteobacteria bacterium]|nr:2-amino-4-hydroxy-6-hydroxymethyldihydropteridine diphosphokinase [Alphaproteobacteria bacterium]